MPDGASIVINASVASFKGLPAFGVYLPPKRPCGPSLEVGRLT